MKDLKYSQGADASAADLGARWYELALRIGIGFAILPHEWIWERSFLEDMARLPKNGRWAALPMFYLEATGYGG